MNILFVCRDMSFIEPLGVMFLSSIAKQDGHATALAIINEEDVLARIERDRPDMVCMSVMSVDAEAFRKLSAGIKDRHPDTMVVMGGPHATFELDAARTWSVDAVVQGEGDLSFRDLVRATDAGKPIDKIPNVSTPTATNPMRRLVEPLDLLPHPDRELAYFPGGHLKDLNVKSFMTSRGCAFRCTYCFNSKYNELYVGNGRPVRRFSVDYMIEEILQVKKDYGLDFVRLGDDVFAYRVDAWMEEFAREYPRQIGLPFYCLIRPDLAKPPLIRMLRRAGCHSISMSIEAGSERLRREVLLRKMDDEIILGAVRCAHDAGIHVYANAMLGLPNTTIADDIETVELAASARVAYPSFTILTPFRGTALGEKCSDMGLIEGDYPEHTTDRSILTCFSKRQKDIQVNLVHMGIFAVRFPFLKSAILSRLIYLRPNPLFFFAWYLMKNYVSAKYIWPINAGPLRKLRLAFRALAYEMSGRLRRREWLGLRRRQARKPGAVSSTVAAPDRSTTVFDDPVAAS